VTGPEDPLGVGKPWERVPCWFLVRREALRRQRSRSAWKVQPFYGGAPDPGPDSWFCDATIFLDGRIQTAPDRLGILDCWIMYFPVPCEHIQSGDRALRLPSATARPSGSPDMVPVAPGDWLSQRKASDTACRTPFARQPFPVSKVRRSPLIDRSPAPSRQGRPAPRRSLPNDQAHAHRCEPPRGNSGRGSRRYPSRGI
jgi:hypothetical protein